MNKAIISLAFVYYFALYASVALAGPGERGDSERSGGKHHGQVGDKIFKEMDANGDGEISRAEFDALHAKRFGEMDANSDGKLTRGEMAASGRKMLEKTRKNRFDEADANHDGALSREEAKRMPILLRNFEKMDKNGDGKVSREEMGTEAKGTPRLSEGKK